MSNLQNEIKNDYLKLYQDSRGVTRFSPFVYLAKGLTNINDYSFSYDVTLYNLTLKELEEKFTQYGVKIFELHSIHSSISDIQMREISSKETFTKEELNKGEDIESFSYLCYLPNTLYDKFILQLEYKVLLSEDNIEYNIKFFSNIKFSEFIKDLSLNLINTFRNTSEEKPMINVITTDGDGFSLSKYKIKKTNLDIELLYGEDFKSKYDILYKRLTNKKDKGIVLFHGEPGTGKTTLIRHLISELIQTGKRVIFLPPNLTSSLSSPSMITFLMEFPDSIFVVEDAEEAIMTRKKNATSAVSNILNMSDGILSDIMNVQFILTCNVDNTEIDKALLRKGRLIAEHKFTKTPKERVEKICAKYNLKNTLNCDATLTEIFNQDELKSDLIEDKEKKVGFYV